MDAISTERVITLLADYILELDQSVRAKFIYLEFVS